MSAGDTGERSFAWRLPYLLIGVIYLCGFLYDRMEGREPGQPGWRWISAAFCVFILVDVIYHYRKRRARARAAEGD